MKNKESKIKYILFAKGSDKMNENKTNINWLVCIYDDYYLNPYKMGLLRNEILQDLIKK